MSKPSQATLLVELALETADLELFHTPDAEAFVMLPAGTHRECWPLRGGPFRRWIARLYFERQGTAPGSQALQDALGVLEGMALFRSDEYEVHLRLAEHDGADLPRPRRRLLAGGPDHRERLGGRARAAGQVPPVAGMRQLPHPTRGGNIDELREYANVGDDDWPLFAAAAVATLRPRGPFPVLQLHGEQGSAKSTTARVLRELVDPNAAPLRSEPRDGRDLMIAAHNGWIVAYDNVSHLAPWLSDAICRLSTGGGFATRELYSNTDEILIDVQRPVVMNGIEDLATRGDLLDRSLILYLPRINSYRREDEFWSAFSEAGPRILGSLLDAVSVALANLDSVRLARAPRMADFAIWATAAEPALGLQRGTFILAYDGNRADAHALSLEASPLTDPVRVVAEAGFAGTATELLDRLVGLVAEDVTRRTTRSAASCSSPWSKVRSGSARPFTCAGATSIVPVSGFGCRGPRPSVTRPAGCTCPSG